MSNPLVTPPTDLDLLRQMILTVRLSTRDFPELNRLISGEESGDRMIAWAIYDTLDDISSTPPLLGSYGIADVPLSLLRQGVVVALLQSIALLHLRNSIDYVDGGVTVGVQNKHSLYMQTWNMLRSLYENAKQRWKTAKNIEGAIGRGSPSEYYILGRLYPLMVG